CGRIIAEIVVRFRRDRTALEPQGLVLEGFPGRIVPHDGFTELRKKVPTSQLLVTDPERLYRVRRHRFSHGGWSCPINNVLPDETVQSAAATSDTAATSCR